MHFYMVYIAYFTEFILQICIYAQKWRIWHENCKYGLDENFHCHFCSRRKAAKFCHPGQIYKRITSLHWLDPFPRQSFLPAQNTRSLLRHLSSHRESYVSTLLSFLMGCLGRWDPFLQQRQPQQPREQITEHQHHNYYISNLISLIIEASQYSEEITLPQHLRIAFYVSKLIQ